MASARKINIRTITSKSLREKKYLDVFPEYYDLEKVTENSQWHDHQNVLDHVISVFQGLEGVLKFEKLDSAQVELMEKYLSEQIGMVSRKDVLIVATLLHDIAKVDTIVKSSDGSARCPGHELIAASRVRKFSERFGLNEQDVEYIERIVRYHGLTAEFLNLIIANGNKEKYLRIFKETVGDVDKELILLMHADLLGSDLEKNDKKAFNDRVSILSWMLAKILTQKNLDILGIN